MSVIRIVVLAGACLSSAACATTTSPAAPMGSFADLAGEYTADLGRTGTLMIVICDDGRFREALVAGASRRILGEGVLMRSDGVVAVRRITIEGSPVNRVASTTASRARRSLAWPGVLGRSDGTNGTSYFGMTIDPVHLELAPSGPDLRDFCGPVR